MGAGGVIPRPGRVAPFIAANPAAGGRDIVVGDVHGCFRTLERALGEIAFDTACDRLFGVGDLVNPSLPTCPRHRRPVELV